MPSQNPDERSLFEKLKLLATTQHKKYQKIPQIPGAQPRPRFDPPVQPSVRNEAPASEAVSETSEPVFSGEKQSVNYALTNPVLAGFMLTVGVGLALLGWYVLTNVGALAGWVVGALLIALGLDPAVRRLEKLGLPRGAGVFTVVSIFALTVVGLLTWVVPTIANQTVQFINGFPQQFDQFLSSDFFRSIDQQWQVRRTVDDTVAKATSEFAANSSILGSFFNNLINAGSTFANIITGTLIVLILSLYFLSSLPLMKAWFVRLTPASRRTRVSELTESITEAVGHYVAGQAIVALLNGTFALIVMMILGISFPQLLTLFVVILAFIPLIGGVAAGTLVSLVCLLDSWQTALGFAIPYFIYLQVEAYFISPRIMSKAVAVPGGIAIIAVAAGGALWGVLGALIAIPVAASILILVKDVLVPRQDEH